MTKNNQIVKRDNSSDSFDFFDDVDNSSSSSSGATTNAFSNNEEPPAEATKNYNKVVFKVFINGSSLLWKCLVFFGARPIPVKIRLSKLIDNGLKDNNTNDVVEANLSSATDLSLDKLRKLICSEFDAMTNTKELRQRDIIASTCTNISYLNTNTDDHIPLSTNDEFIDMVEGAMDKSKTTSTDDEVVLVLKAIVRVKRRRNQEVYDHHRHEEMPNTLCFLGLLMFLVLYISICTSNNILHAKIDDRIQQQQIVWEDKIQQQQVLWDDKFQQQQVLWDDKFQKKDGDYCLSNKFRQKNQHKICSDFLRAVLLRDSSYGYYRVNYKDWGYFQNHCLPYLNDSDDEKKNNNKKV